MRPPPIPTFYHSIAKDIFIKFIFTQYNMSTFNKISQFIQRLLSDHNKVKLEISNRKITRKSQSMWILNNIFLFFFLTLQYCIGFALYQHESNSGIHMFPILNPPPSSLPVPSLWVVPVHQPQASSIVHRTWTGDSFHIWYYTCFNAIFPNYPTLSLSHRVQKTVLYISVSFAVSYTELLSPSF